MTFEGVLAIVRLRRHEPVPEIAEALARGGVRQLEVTLPTPGAERAIAEWSALPDVLVGAGTVRTGADAHRAIAAGARFLVTPTVAISVLEVAAAADVPVISGASTPTEMETARRAGATVVKVFPAKALGGPAYIRAVREPLDDVPMMATGGVGVADTGDYRRAGCIGVGVGGALVAEELVARRDWPIITSRAASFTAAWDGTRAAADG